MSNREFDTFIMGLTIGGVACLWLGYHLRVRVERWHVRRSTRRSEASQLAAVRIRQERGAAQRVRSVLASRPQVIPLRDPNTGRSTPRHVDMQRIPIMRELRAEDVERRLERLASIPQAGPGSSRENDQLRMDVYSALVDAGFTKVVAREAVEACTPEERAGCLESWVAAAMRRAVSKP